MEVLVMVTHRGGFAFILDTVHNTSGFCPCFVVTNSRHFAEYFLTDSLSGEIDGHKPA